MREPALRKTSIFLSLLILILALIALAGCSPAPEGANQPSGAEKVATFNGGEVTQGQVQAEVDRYAQQSGAGAITPASPQWNALKDQVMQQLLTFSVAGAYARENNITVPPAEVQSQIDKTKQQVGAQARQSGQQLSDDQAFQTALKQAGYTEASFRDLVQSSLVVRSVQDQVTKGVAATPQEVQQYYDQNKDSQFTTPEQRCVRHILFTQDQEKLAGDVKQQLQNGGSWDELAKKYSQDPGSKDKGGDLGCESNGAYVKEFDDAVWNAREGDVVGPVKTQFGYHILQVTQVKPKEVRPLDQVRQQIQDTLTQEQRAAKFNTWVQEQLKARQVKYLPDYNPTPPPAPPGAAPAPPSTEPAQPSMEPTQPGAESSTQPGTPAQPSTEPAATAP